MGAHALLSASSAARWLNCPRSVRLTENIRDEGSSVYAAEGTLAHAVAENALQWYKDHGSLKGWRVPRKLKDSDLWYDGMKDDVLPYVEYVIETFESRSAAAALDIETRLDFSEYVPGGFGTGDAVIVDDGFIEIIDLKFGKGVPVEADHNPQTMLYGLGAYLLYDFIYDIKRVKMTIVQPRLDHITSFELSEKDLVYWAANTVKPIARLAYEGQGEQKAGDWCRWCKIKATCKVRAQSLLAITEKRNQAELSDAEISEILAARDAIKRWLTDIEDEVMDRLTAGGKLAGWKLVEGRSNRKINEPDKLAGRLLEQYSPELIYRPQELKTLTDLEKLVGKKRFAEEFGAYVYKPDGKPTLVPESDKRPALHSPEAEFEFEEAEG